MTRRLLLLINSLEGGGAEKVMIKLAGQFDKGLQDAEIRLALLDDVSQAYPVPSGIDLIRLDSRGSFLRSISQTKRLIRSWRPDVVLSFLTRANCASVMARGQASFRCVISERVNTTSHLGSRLRGRVLGRVVSMLYPRADAVVAVSQGVGDDLLQNYNIVESKLSVIGNPVDVEELNFRASMDPEIPLPEDFLVSVGRLVPNKGGHILLRAFAAHRNKTRSLVMLGDGAERERLRASARELGIAERVIMPGHVENPHAIVRRAAAYVSASRSEGFPNALVEAMAVGCPVAATDCHSGPAEILAAAKTGGVKAMQAVRWGVLVPVDDVAALSAAMDFLDSREQRQIYADRAKQRVGDYSVLSIVEEYARVLEL